MILFLLWEVLGNADCSEFCVKLPLSMLCLSSDAEKSMLQGSGSASETSAQEPSELTAEACRQGDCRAVWSSRVPRPAVLGLQKARELVGFRISSG